MNEQLSYVSYINSAIDAQRESVMANLYGLLPPSVYTSRLVM